MTQDNNTQSAIEPNDTPAIEPSTNVLIQREELAIAREHWKAVISGAPRDRAAWALIGKAVVTFKENHAFSNGGKQPSNKAVGEFVDANFPGLRKRPELVSYAQKLHHNFHLIDPWASVNCPDLSTPKHLVSKWEAATRTKAEPATEPATEPEPADHQSIDKARLDALNALTKSFLEVAEKLHKDLSISRNGLDPATLAMVRSKAVALAALLTPAALNGSEVTEQKAA